MLFEKTETGREIIEAQYNLAEAMVIYNYPELASLFSNEQSQERKAYKRRLITSLLEVVDSMDDKGIRDENVKVAIGLIDKYIESGDNNKYDWALATSLYKTEVPKDEAHDVIVKPINAVKADINGRYYIYIDKRIFYVTDEEFECIKGLIDAANMLIMDEMPMFYDMFMAAAKNAISVGVYNKPCKCKVEEVEDNRAPEK